MKYIEAIVMIKADRPNLIQELVVSAFDDLGLSGVVIHDPDNLYEALPPDAVVDLEKASDENDHLFSHVTHPAVIGYFPIDGTERKKRAALESALTDLNSALEADTSVSYQHVDEEDWANAWKTFFHPEKIGDKVVVKPTWHDYAVQPDEIVVEIDPGMAFGTGTHPTTAMSIQMIEAHLKPSHRVLDIGTGSGILLITAAKLGASCGVGIDNDAVAIAAASANLEQNRIDRDQFSIVQGDLVEPIKARFDLITANILAEAILDLIVPISQKIVPDGLFISSGIIESKADTILEHLNVNGFQLVEKQDMDSWVCIVARFKKHQG